MGVMMDRNLGFMKKSPDSNPLNQWGTRLSGMCARFSYTRFSVRVYKRVLGGFRIVEQRKIGPRFKSDGPEHALIGCGPVLGPHRDPYGGTLLA